jgi:mannose-6-phosphate isomerase-like protein (cupin superfamily)
MELRLRPWREDEHLRHLSEGKWGPMYDDAGVKLFDIEGKRGVMARKADGTHIGCDFIRMYPGARFPLHTHEGDHEIYFISGIGFVHIDGEDICVTAGHLIHIPAEYPHAVWVGEEASEPLIFAATGHPHYHIHSAQRMTVCVTPGDDTAGHSD